MAENAELRRRLERAELVATVAQGQLATFTGDPVAWPTDLDAAWGPDAVRARLDAFARAHPEAKVEGVDCDEYPCVASVTVAGDPSVAQALARALTTDLAAPGTDDPAAMVMVAGRDDGGPPSSTIAAAVLPPTHAEDPDVQARVKHRAEELLQGSEPPRP